MDRKYKAPERVRVFATSPDEKPVDTIRVKPFQCFGFDNYRYSKTCKFYPGFYRDDTGTYILLNKPL